MDRITIFAYGTLLTGGLSPSIDRLIREHGLERREAQLRGRLYDLGAYPGLVPAARRDERVHGQLLRLDQARRCLPAFDAYEDYDPSAPERSLYQRVWTRVQLADGSRRQAWVYWYRGPVRAARRIPHGDWRAWVGISAAARSSAADSDRTT